ncbi:hypothetical protein [Klebsiella pneumoniae]|uniref:hypothetical protein n=1 Tax=Klebsiella pneumoniae TaxID=573 RepID=UPI003C744CFE
MIITGLAVGFIMILVGIWRYYHCEKRAGKIISAGIIMSGVLVITGVFAIDAVNYKRNPYQENTGKYYSKECKPLVLSGGNTAGEVNIIKCNETILQVDAAEYDAAVGAYRKSAYTKD